MAAQRVFHWKHGWIPLDHYAAVEAMNGRKSTGKMRSSYTPSIEDIQKLLRPEQQQMQSESDVNYNDPALFSDMDKVDGVDFRTFKSKDLDPGDGSAPPHKFTAGQKKEIAAVLNDLHRKFPQSKPITIVGTKDRDSDGTTEWSGRRISLSSMLFNHADIMESRASFGDHGSVGSAGPKTDAAFRKGVITHEFGHAMEMQKGDAQTAGSIIANQRVTPADLGIKVPPGGPPLSAPRWKVDTLDFKSAYAGTNEYEWFAEAFTDGVLNGDTASKSSKNILALVSTFYAGKAAS